MQLGDARDEWRVVLLSEQLHDGVNTGITAFCPLGGGPPAQGGGGGGIDFRRVCALTACDMLT